MTDKEFINIGKQLGSSDGWVKGHRYAVNTILEILDEEIIDEVKAKHETEWEEKDKHAYCVRTLENVRNTLIKLFNVE